MQTFGPGVEHRKRTRYRTISGFIIHKTIEAFDRLQYSSLRTQTGQVTQISANKYKLNPFTV